MNIYVSNVNQSSNQEEHIPNTVDIHVLLNPDIQVLASLAVSAMGEPNAAGPTATQSEFGSILVG